MSDFEVIRSLGEPALLEQLAEECSELAQAALKLARLERGENPTPKTEEECVGALKEELADVGLCMDVIITRKGIYGVYELQYDKQKRWALRIREARGETPKETLKEKKKTRQSEFLKMFPNALMNEDPRTISICPQQVDGRIGCDGKCYQCSKDFWLAEAD